MLSGLLFNLYADIFLKSLRLSGLGCHLKNLYVGCIMYADDLILLSASVNDLQNMLQICDAVGKDLGIKFNASKSNSLVSSKLDYCNSLFCGLPDTSLHRLQLVQNALARIVVPTVRRSHHISPTLRSLHWLPIPQRITFKIASIPFNTLQDNQPS